MSGPSYWKPSTTGFKCITISHIEFWYNVCYHWQSHKLGQLKISGNLYFSYWLVTSSFLKFNCSRMIYFCSLTSCMWSVSNATKCFQSNLRSSRRLSWLALMKWLIRKCPHWKCRICYRSWYIAMPIYLLKVRIFGRHLKLKFVTNSSHWNIFAQ